MAIIRAMPPISEMTAADMRAWRLELRLYQHQAAEELGITERQLRNYETGAAAIPRSIARACRDMTRERRSRELAAELRDLADRLDAGEA